MASFPTTTVRIIVRSSEGDITVEVQPEMRQLSDNEPDVINQLLVDAVTKVRRAYGIDE
ncbi:MULTISPECIES: hypothetical protein [Rhodococcus]|uniref:hypothetical protein n=1 Tax=Rhodococcus TaxID=1827 RepID=UPI0002ECDFB7|nr:MULTISPECIES: hypothetical protein [Rhodococcus]QQZ17720.1 hypothetical protein GO592_17455 [Rhodococcus sp. 21391]